MNLIKIGSSYVNFDQVTEIRDVGVDIEIFFGINDLTTVRGADAERLRQWLDKIATDLNEQVE